MALLVACFVAVTQVVAVESHSTGGVELSRILLDAIRYTESRGDVCDLGDNGRSLGAYHIERDHYTDAVEANGTLTANGEGI